MIEPARILHVEDQQTNRLLLRAALARADDPHLVGAALYEADTLGEARAILARERIDLILLDVRLPDGSGLDLSAQLAADSPPAERPRIIVVTASVLAADRASAQGAGVDAFIAKPYAPRELLELMSRMIRRDTDASRDEASAPRS